MFLTDVRSIKLDEVYFVKSTSLKTELHSVFYIKKENNEGINFPKNEKILPEKKNIFSEFKQNNRLIIEDLKCSIATDEPFKFQYVSNKLEFSGGGEFNMAFINEKFSVYDVETAVSKFATITESKPPKTSFTTVWAHVTCEEKGNTLTPTYDLQYRRKDTQDIEIDQKIQPQTPFETWLSFGGDGLRQKNTFYLALCQFINCSLNELI